MRSPRGYHDDILAEGVNLDGGFDEGWGLAYSKLVIKVVSPGEHFVVGGEGEGVGGSTTDLLDNTANGGDGSHVY